MTKRIFGLCSNCEHQNEPDCRSTDAFMCPWYKAKPPAPKPCPKCAELEAKLGRLEAVAQRWELMAKTFCQQIERSVDPALNAERAEAASRLLQCAVILREELGR